MSMYKQKIVGKTKGGKTIAYSVKEGESLYTIHFTTGGVVPDALLGGWTDRRQIENAVNAYLMKDTLSPTDQAKKTQRQNVIAAKKRPNTLKAKKGALINA